MIKTHKDLDVWKKSMDLVMDIYRDTQIFPKEEVYSLTSQIRRAAVSIPSNVAEGASRNSKKEFCQYLYIALGSASELETQILIADRLGYVQDSGKILEKTEAIKKMLNGLIRHLIRRAP
jgi:four helix bundle protein